MAGLYPLRSDKDMAEWLREQADQMAADRRERVLKRADAIAKMVEKEAKK